MKKKYIISLFLLVFALPLFAASEAEYRKLSKTYTLNSDGSQEYRYSMELTLFTHTAMNRTYGESFIVYNPEFQELKIHSSYTKQKDGTIIRTPENAFVEVLPRQAAKAPAFNHLKEMVVVHTGLELEATIYLDYSVISKPGYLPALDICEAIAQTSPVKDYTITVKAPANEPLFYDLSNHPAKSAVTSSDGMKEVVWKIRNLSAASMAPQVTALGGDVPLLTVSGFASNNDALKYLNKQLTPSGNASVQTVLKAVVNGKETGSEKIYAILNYVTDNLDLSRLSLAETGFRLRSVDEVLNSAYGTETEKVALLAGMLNAAGIKADIVAAYLSDADINSYGLSAINELFVLVDTDGKQYLLTPKQKKMSEAGWYAGYAKFVNISNPGNTVNIETPSTDLNYTYAITIKDEKAEIQAETNVGTAFIPYTGNTARDSYSTSQQLEKVGSYILFSLPDSPNSLSHAPYKNYNSMRSENLLLPYKAKESYKYIIQLPENIKLKTSVSEKTIDKKVGLTTISIKQNGNIVEVVRTLEIKKQLISSAEYSSFRSIMNEWAGNNKLLFVIDDTKK